MGRGALDKEMLREVCRCYCYLLSHFGRPGLHRIPRGDPCHGQAEPPTCGGDDHVMFQLLPRWPTYYQRLMKTSRSPQMGFTSATGWFWYLPNLQTYWEVNNWRGWVMGWGELLSNSPKEGHRSPKVLGKYYSYSTGVFAHGYLRASTSETHAQVLETARTGAAAGHSGESGREHRHAPRMRGPHTPNRRAEIPIYGQSPAYQPQYSSQLPKPMCEVLTPLNWREWDRLLTLHLDQRFRAYIFRGIQEGFRKGFDCSINLHSVKCPAVISLTFLSLVLAC